MPPAPPDSLVGRVSGPVGVARQTRTPRRALNPGRPGGQNRQNRQSQKSLLAIPEVGSEGCLEDSPEKKPKTSSALEALLVDLGSQIHRGDSLLSQGLSQEGSRSCPTGLERLDARLGGGFPIGRLSEICGAPSSGRTALALALLAETLDRGALAAWIDLADAFDPISSNLASGDLEQLLWVRARCEDEVLRSCERLLQTEGFELVILDLATLPTRSTHSTRSPAIRDTSWLRLARKAANTRTALVAITNSTRTGSRSELVLEMKPRIARFVGPPNLLEVLETTAILQRHRNRPTGHEVPIQVHAEKSEPEAHLGPRRGGR